MKNRTLTFVDPPSGWKYGFPIYLPETERYNLNKFLVNNGYPQEEIDELGDSFYVRFLSKEVPEEEYFTIVLESLERQADMSLKLIQEINEQLDKNLEIINKLREDGKI